MDVDNNTRGFAELRAVYAVWDKYPEVMVNACVNYHSRKNFSLFSDEERDLCRPYVVLYMSYAGRPLNKVKFQSALQIRSVVQQVALALAVGEGALEFEHRALTPAHVLVNEVQDQVVPFVLNGRALLLNVFGVQVSIVDFSAARMTLAGKATDSQPVYADLTKLPARKRAALGDTFAMVYHFISEDLSRFHAWTNMEYLEALTRTLVNAHDRHFASAADEEERRAWRDVCFWLAEMPHWGGARPFALELVAPSIPFTKASTSTSRHR
ncbi:serine/threonine-protein kinase haspin-like [Dermacentor andersoni]|uniref:serine/threonine-protein kinase haspin-like n=1 Tax=Dermacentor andersoni TaxID=34620 RepID=UPI0024165577|nr:serine/threonine-protein kinase haspin-like [Dermacentor andersoni]